MPFIRRGLGKGRRGRSTSSFSWFPGRGLRGQGRPGGAQQRERPLQGWSGTSFAEGAQGEGATNVPGMGGRTHGEETSLPVTQAPIAVPSHTRRRVTPGSERRKIPGGPSLAACSRDTAPRTRCQARAHPSLEQGPVTLAPQPRGRMNPEKAGPWPQRGRRRVCRD